MCLCELYISALSHVTKIKFSSSVCDIYKQIVSIMSRLSNSTQGWRSLYFQAQAVYLNIQTS